MEATSSPALACVYVLTLDEPHRTRASVSAAMLRDHDPDLHVTLLVPGRPDREQRAAASRLLALADDVRLVASMHEASGYFQDNRAHLAAVDADRIVYLDADTLVFGSVQALAARFAAADVAARPSPWVWQRGYRHGLAPDIVAPLNGGVLCLSRAFCAHWTAGAVARHASLLHDPGRRELAAWLRSVTPHAYHRDEFVLSELAWSTPWRAQTMQATDCHLLERWPSQEDPETWLRATILHTYSSEWEACVERLRAVVDVPYARRSPARPKEVLVATTSELTPADRSALDRRFDQRWVDWVVAHLLGRADRAAIVDVMVRRDFPREYAETRVAAIADSPILAAAARAHRPAAKAASFLEVLAELHRRGGFTLERRRLSPDAFYREHVFPNLPVILPGLIDGWPAMTEWRPERLKERFGHAVVEVTAGRESDARYEDNFRAHRSSMSFGAYVDLVEQSGASNDHYLVARNDVLYQTDLAGLRDDFDVPPGYLDPAGTARRYVRLWYGPAGTVTPLHCDNRNVLFAQVRVGSRCTWSRRSSSSPWPTTGPATAPSISTTWISSAIRPCAACRC